MVPSVSQEKREQAMEYALILISHFRVTMINPIHIYRNTIFLSIWFFLPFSVRSSFSYFFENGVMWLWIYIWTVYTVNSNEKINANAKEIVSFDYINYTQTVKLVMNLHRSDLINCTYWKPFLISIYSFTFCFNFLDFIFSIKRYSHMPLN